MEKEEDLWEEVGGEGTLMGELWIGLPGEGREEEVEEEGEREGEGEERKQEGGNYIITCTY